MSVHHNSRAKEILAEIKYATLATVTPDGKAWNSPVAHDLDDEYNVYWFSDKENQHSINIRNNESVFIVIYDSRAPEGTGEGVYMDATAREISDSKEIAQIKELLGVDDLDEFLGDSIRRCYKATPQKMWMNDAEEKDGVFLRDYRVEINLK